MIEYLNNEHMTIDDRRDSLERSLNATPFFHLLEYEVLAGSTSDKQYAAKAEINKDFFLTDMRSNFGQMRNITGAFFDINVYIANEQASVYNFNRSQPLQSGLITTDARFSTNLFFEDRQRESMPYRIARGNRVISEIQNVNTKTDPDDAKVMLAGFTFNQYPFFDSKAIEQINKSLEKPTRFYYFKITVPSTLNGKRSFSIRNDNFPRQILGFGAVNSSTNKAQISEVTVSIKDTTREIRWNNDPIPLEFLAPRLTCVEDTNLYHLPIEYYFQPFANLQFDINNVPLDDPAGFELYVLTRTV